MICHDVDGLHDVCVGLINNTVVVPEFGHLHMVCMDAPKRVTLKNCTFFGDYLRKTSAEGYLAKR